MYGSVAWSFEILYAKISSARYIPNTLYFFSNAKASDETAEKEVISNDAIGGFYYFKSGKLFVDYANKLIDRKLTTKGEYYIAPVYNLLINDEYKIGIDRNTKHIILGTPADLERYLSAS